MPDGAVVIADPNLIFHGEFKRTGVDLVLSHDGHEVVVHDYFRGDKRAAIASPDGAHLTGDVVSALTGYVQYAQAAPGAAAAQVIGHVTKLTGSATAIRNGVSVILNNGDNVEKGDVVSTGSDSTLGVTFIDGTVFGLSSNARMVLNEMVYDPNGSNNSSLLSLVAGTITFVAGETAKHGDMKIDTPVATMGIRGTAVLTEINFVVPSGGGDPQPQANFQVLVEPNGTTGSYILFDKLTLLPIATVNQAGQMIQISGGNVSVTNALLSPDVQKLITDVFTLKFTDNNTNTKLTTNFTDTITQNGNIVFIKTDTGATATATFTNTVNNGTGPAQGGTDKGGDRFPGPPQARSLDADGNVTSSFKMTEHANATADHLDATGDTVGPDILIFRINFVDQNLGDRPTVSVNLADAPNYVYMDASHHDVTGSLSALQKQDIAATQIQINVAADGGNNNNGSATLTYTIPDHTFDFLAAGETLTLTYMVHVNDNFAVHPESTDIPITITITGTNDKPVITTSVPTITFSGGTSVPGGPLISTVPTSGTLSFTDVDLTDTHSVLVVLTSASLPDGIVPPGPLAIFEHAMSVLLEKDSTQTGNNTGIIDWSLADLPAYVADFIPKGEVLTLTYTVTLTDSQGATSTQTITVAIKGTDSPAVVWIATKETGAPSGGLWGDKLNWETHTVPTINDDVLIITDQLRGLTPSYPVSIDAAAFAKSLIMDDYNTSPPELINNSTLTIAGALTLNADSKFTNSAGGHVLVGGKIDVEATSRGTGTVTNTSTITNAGTLTLAAGGTIDTRTTISNSGMFDLSGGTLTLKSNVANVDGILKTDAGTTLIVDTATIDGGTVNIAGTLELDGTSVIENGALNNFAAVNVKGTTEFAHETITNADTGTIEVLASGALAIDQSTLGNAGSVEVDTGGELILNDATITGGTINGTGTIDVTGTSKIDGGATLSTSFVTIDAGQTLMLDDATVSGTAITNGGTVKVDANSKLTLAGASLTGGTLTVSGRLASSGTTTITDASILNSDLIESTLGGLLTLLATTPAAAITNDETIRANGAELDINGEAVTNTGTLAAINDGTLKLIATKVTNAGGAVSIESGSTLDLSSAIVNGGTLTISGTLESNGTSAITDANIANTGTMSVTSGTLTIDPPVLHTITNSHLIQAIGGELDIIGEQIVNTAAIKAIGGGILKLTSLTVTNDGGTFTVDGTSKLYLSDAATINGGQLSNFGHLYSVSGSNTISAAVTNTDTIEVQAGTLNLSGGVTGTGTLVIDDSATLKLAGATAQTVTFAGGADKLQLDKVAGQSFSGTIAGQSSKGGTFTITGAADITTSSGDALDFTAAGGTSGSHGNIVLTPTGTLTGHDNGIVVTQSGIGDISLTTVGDVTGQTDNGIVLHDRATGAGDITATIGGGVSGAVGLDVVSHGNGAVTITNNGHITGTTSFGIQVDRDDAGAAGSTHITNHGTVVGADGFAAISIQDNGTRAAVIDNFDTIGPDAGSVSSTTYAIVETGGAIEINNSGQINGNISVASATFDNKSAGTWTVSGTSVFGALSTIDNAGEIDLLNGASVSSADGVTFAITNSGKIESWGTSSITGHITNTNTIEVHTGTLSLFGSLSGAGSVTIDANATLVVDATVSQTVTFGGTGAELDIHTTDFGGSIAGLAATDRIDLSSIDYGLGTSAVYVANANASTGGTLTITDACGHHISLTLTGADYSNATFAGSDDGTGHTLITVNAADDAPKFTAVGATLTAGFSELADTTGASTTYDPAPAATGSIAFTDVDLTDRPTVTITHQDVTWLDSDHATQLTLTPGEISALETALTLQQTGKNNGTVGWSYSIADGALDFLADGQTAKVLSTITLDDHQGQKVTADVTITIHGTNDAPTLDNATLAAISEDATNPAGSTVGKLFAAGFHDVDANSSFKAVAITADHATQAQGVWQYEVAGSNHWVDISCVSDTSALVLATDTLIRFVPAANYSGVPGGLDVHALDDTYGGHVTTPTLIDITAPGIGSSVSAQAATLGTDVTPVADPPAFTAMTVNYVVDSLTGNTIDPSKWHVVLPSVPGTANDASVTPTANGVVLHDHGYLETTTGFTPTAATPLHISLSFSLDDGVGPYVAVTDGTDGTTGAYGSPVNGLSFMFGWGHGLVINNNAVPNHSAYFNASLRQGTVYDTTITDDGSHQTVVIVDHATGQTVGIYTSDLTGYMAGNLVTITNREANDSRHDATVSNVTISNAFEGAHGTPIALSGLTAVTDTDGSEHLSLDLSGFPVGTTFSVGQAGTGAAAGHWLISASDIASLGASALTITTPTDYSGEFSLHVRGTVVDTANGLSGQLTDTKTFANDVAVKVDGGPIIDTTSLHVTHNSGHTDTITNLSVLDTDSGASTDCFTMTASTSPVPATDTSSVNVSPTSGSLNALNLGLANGITYHPGSPAPHQDQITLTVTDKTTGLYDIVNFIFNEAGDTSHGITLQGTSGKDVIFATTSGDTLTGGGGKDQFVFAPGSGGDDATHTITDFAEGLDKIDLRQFSDVSSIGNLHIAQQSSGTLVTWQQHVGHGEGSVTEHESLLLKNVVANLKASDFIFHT